MTPKLTHNRIVFLISAALVVMTLAAYEPVRKNDFVSYDDRIYVTNNPNVNKGITVNSVIWAFTKTRSSNWHPLTWLSHTLDCEIYGLNPVGHHITSLLIHTTSSVLLFLLLLKMTGSTWASAFVAAMFAVHPLHVESVAWVAERKDVLSGLFWILTMFAYVRYAERPNPGRYALVLVAFVMGIMSKPMVVTLPFVLLLLDYWPLERVGRQGTKNVFQKASVRKLIVEKIPLFVLSAVSSVITLTSQRSGGSFATLWTVSAGYRIANMFASYIRYIGKTIWPSRLAVYYPHPREEISFATTAICAFLFVMMSIILIHIGRRKKYALVGWLWYVGTLVPVIGLVQVGTQAMADRYMYLPIIGLLIIAAWGIKDLIAGRPRRKIAAAVSATLVLLAAVILTRTQVRYWQNSISLFAHTLKVTENNPLAENNYGSALYEAGRLDEAVTYLSSALRRVPMLAEARINLGLVFLKQGKLDEAISCFNEVIQHGQASAKVYYNLAIALSGQHKYEDAIKNLAKVLELEPDYPDAHNKMGTLLATTGRIDEAIMQFNEAIRTDKDKAKLYVNLGRAYQQTGKYDSAIHSWSKAAELRPSDVDILNNLAWLLATVSDTTLQDADRAIELAEHACKITEYKQPSLLDTLAAAYAAGGRFEEAVKTAHRAIDTAKAQGQEELAGRIEKRKELYQAGRRYIQK
jgi:tetratricopeptide (TPR) repeat protein